MPAAHRRSLGAVSATALLFAVLGVAPVSAGEPIALEQRVVRGAEGTVEELTEVPVDDDEIGVRCTLDVHTENQYSVHPGNDLVVTTGGVETIIPEVEAEPDADRDLAAEVVLGPTIVVALRFGPDEVSSMGFELSIDCDRPTVAAASSSTRPPPTEVPVVPPSIPGPCATPTTSAGGTVPGGGAGLSVGPDECSTPTVLPTVLERTPSTVAAVDLDPTPSSAPSSTSPSVPTTTTTTTATAAAPPTGPPTTGGGASGPPGDGSASTSTPSGPTPTVAGIQITRGLPDTPAAVAVPAQPAYTG